MLKIIEKLEKDVNEIEYELNVETVSWFRTVAVFMLLNNYDKSDIVEYLTAVNETDGTKSIKNGMFNLNNKANEKSFFSVLKFVANKTKYLLALTEVDVPEKTFFLYEYRGFYSFGFSITDELLYSGNIRPYHINKNQVNILHMYTLKKR